MRRLNYSVSLMNAYLQQQYRQISVYCNILKNAVIILEFEQCGFSMELCIHPKDTDRMSNNQTAPDLPVQGTFRCASDWYSRGRGFDPPVRHYFFVKIGHEIISTAILSLLLIQVEQLSVTGECPGKVWLG